MKGQQKKLLNGLYVTNYDQNSAQITVITTEPITLEKIEGGSVLIEPAATEPLKKLLREEHLKDIQTQAGIGASKVHRIKKALGLSTKYQGGSRTSKWRNKQDN